jgi:GNAT superfamily N-acetyltransferase
VAAVEIVAYERGMLEGMLELYNAETAFEPHIAALTPDLFVDLVEQKSYFDSRGVLVAVDSGRVAGWVHACVAVGSEPWHDPATRVARIRMLIFPRSRLDVGRALVTEAVEWLRQKGETEIEAMHAKAGYPFYRGLWMGGEPMCPATLPHVQLALELGGFKSTQESVCMVAEIEEPPTTLLEARGVELVESPAEMEHEGMRESWVGFSPMRTNAVLDGDPAGGIGWVVLPHVAEKLGTPCVNIWGLGVNEAHRRKGIATRLVAHVLSRGYEQGCRFASVGTQLWNAPAHATYAKFGFAPYCLLIGRGLDLTSDKA